MEVKRKLGDQGKSPAHLRWAMLVKKRTKQLEPQLTGCSKVSRPSMSMSSDTCTTITNEHAIIVSQALPVLGHQQCSGSQPCLPAHTDHPSGNTFRACSKPWPVESTTCCQVGDSWNRPSAQQHACGHPEIHRCIARRCRSGQRHQMVSHQRGRVLSRLRTL